MAAQSADTESTRQRAGVLVSAGSLNAAMKMGECSAPQLLAL